MAFIDPTGVDHDALGAGLKKAIYNYMHGIGLEEDVRMWFPFKVPKTTVRRDRIERAARARLTAPGSFEPFWPVAPVQQAPVAIKTIAS